MLDERVEAECCPDESTHRFVGVLDWGRAYRDVVDNEAVVPHLEALLGDRFRLDHFYLDIIRSGTSPTGATLHGGGVPFDPCQYYHFRDGRMHNGLTVVAYNIADVGEQDGGFACVPGSHKSNYPLPDEWANLQRGVHAAVRRVTGPRGRRSSSPRH